MVVLKLNFPFPPGPSSISRLPRSTRRSGRIFMLRYRGKFSTLLPFLPDLVIPTFFWADSSAPMYEENPKTSFDVKENRKGIAKLKENISLPRATIDDEFWSAQDSALSDFRKLRPRLYIHLRLYFTNRILIMVDAAPWTETFHLTISRAHDLGGKALDNSGDVRKWACRLNCCQGLTKVYEKR